MLTQLGQRADAGEGLADEGRREAELRHAADEELVLLREAEALDAEELRMQPMLNTLDRRMLCSTENIVHD